MRLVLCLRTVCPAGFGDGPHDPGGLGTNPLKRKAGIRCGGGWIEPVEGRAPCCLYPMQTRSASVPLRFLFVTLLPLLKVEICYSEISNASAVSDIVSSFFYKIADVVVIDKQVMLSLFVGVLLQWLALVRRGAVCTDQSVIGTGLAGR